MSVEKKIHAASGWAMLAAVIAGYLVSNVLLIMAIINVDSGRMSGLSFLALLLLSCFLFIACIICSCGFFTLQPGQARVCVLFGKYVGTVRDEGLRWANPFYSRSLGM